MISCADAESLAQAAGKSSRDKGTSREIALTPDIAGCIGHDLNNLLDIILKSATMQLRLSADLKVAENSRRIQAAVRHAALLTHQLFTISEVGPGAMVEVTPALHEVVNLARVAAGERINIQIQSAPETWTVSADPSEFGRAILNLLINGTQAIRGSGTVVVKSLNTVLSVDQSAKLSLGGQDFVQIQITDSGRGMSAATLAQAFVPHFTTKPSAGKSGLGLAQVHAFIRRSGGAIEAVSGVGAGTTMSMYLPRAHRRGPLAPWAGDRTLEPGK
jgi:signal transduction histidine kinase